MEDTETRDKELVTAIHAFFKEGADMCEFKHVVKAAIDSLPVDALEINGSESKALRKAKITVVGQLRSLSDNDLILSPGIGMSALRHVRAMSAPFNTNHLFAEERRGVRPTNTCQANELSEARPA